MLLLKCYALRIVIDLLTSLLCYLVLFISTSLSESVAKNFGNYIFVITLYGKGFKGVEKVSYYPNEKEVLIEAYSKFRITDIRGNYYYMDKLEKNN